MWGGGQEITGRAMEYVESESYTNLPKLIDFFKSEAPLRRTQDHGVDDSGEQVASYAFWPGSVPHPGGEAGNGAASQVQSPAIAIDDGRSLKLEPPSSGNFVDFLGGNGGDPAKFHQRAADVSRSSSDDAGTKQCPIMVPKSSSITQEPAVTTSTGPDQWSVAMAQRRSLPNLMLKLLSPSPTGTQASGTSPPKTPTFDMELNSRTRNTVTTSNIPDHHDGGESSTFSANSDRRVTVETSRINHFQNLTSGDPFHQVGSTSRVHRWSPKNGSKRLKIRTQDEEDDDTDTVDDPADMVEGSNVESRAQMCCERDEQEAEAVVQAAASLLSLSSNDDDWKPTSSAPRLNLRRTGSSSSALAVIPERSKDEATKENDLSSSERDSGESGSIVECSVLSRPSNKRRYRLMVDLLAESPRVR